MFNDLVGLDRKIPQDFTFLHYPVMNQEHVHTICHYILEVIYCIVANGFSLLLYYVFSVLVLYQIRAGANDACVAFSKFLLQSLECAASLVLPMLYFTELVLITCLCAAQRRLSVSFSSSPFPKHSHFLLSLWHSVSLRGCHVGLLSSTLSISFLSFLSCSH